MNDPLYNHPAWKEDRAGEPVNMDHVISEIVKSNYILPSQWSHMHDPASAIEDESTEGELKPSLNLRFGDFELRMKMATSEHRQSLY